MLILEDNNLPFGVKIVLQANNKNDVMIFMAYPLIDKTWLQRACKSTVTKVRMKHVDRARVGFIQEGENAPN